MLRKFAVTNFRGFAERIEWDLSRHASYAFNDFAIKDGIVKDGIIYGPNGSGKTNFSMAIFDIENHLSSKWKDPFYYDNFAYLGRVKDPVVFEYEFDFDGTSVCYSYSKKSQGELVEERLTVDGELLFAHDNDDLFIDAHSFPMPESVMKNLIESSNSISWVKYLVTSYPLTDKHPLMQLMKFVDSMLWFRNVDVRGFMGLEPGGCNMDEDIISKDLVSDFAAFLKKVSGQEFNLESDVTGKDLMCVIDGQRMQFHKVISTGTRALELLYFWLQRMKNASFVFIDEFDAFYHFELSMEVCRRLFAFDCQAFVSTHNTFLLDNNLLRPDCYFIIDKGIIKPINECTDKELRAAHNLEKIYRSGALTVNK